MTGRASEEGSAVVYRVSHSMPGRVRFTIPRIAADAQYARNVTALVESAPDVSRVRVNVAAASVAVSYQTGRVQEAEMRSRLVALLQSARDSAPATGTSRPVGHSTWQRLTLPAVSTALAVLGGPLGVMIPAPIIVGVVAAASVPIARRAVASVMVERRLNIDVLDLIAVTLTTLQGTFLVPAVTIALVEFGEAIRERTARASQSEALDLLGSLAQFVWLDRNGEHQEVPIQDVRRGEVVVVYPGDLIPVDGRVLAGRALIDEQQLTGEASPVVREQGQAVYASTMVQEGQMHIRTELVGVETRAGQIMRVMQEAPVHDTRIEDYAARIADRAVLPTLLLSGAVLAATRNPSRAASVLITDFATGIRVSVPTTVLAALTAAARRGVLIRSGRALEQLGRVDTVVFDKTGTVTEGKPSVVGVESVSRTIPPSQVLALAASAEQNLAHPAAAAVVRYASEHAVELLPCEEWDYHVGLGVYARIGGRKILVGSPRLLLQEGIELRPCNGSHPEMQGRRDSVIYVASDGEMQGTITYADPLRPESRAVLDSLRAAGMEVHLLTGDNSRVAMAVAEQLGIASENTHAEMFPEQKATTVRALRAQGRTVAFVGDGINDSPALAYADVSVSFGGGSDIAREGADVVLMRDDLRGLTEAIGISGRAAGLIRQNIGIVAGPNLAALMLAATTGLSPVTATVVNHGTMVVAGLNGLRPLLEGDAVGSGTPQIIR